MGTKKQILVPMGTKVPKWGPMWEQWIPVLGFGLDNPVVPLVGLHFPQAGPQLCSTRTFPLLSYSLDFCNDGRLHEAIGLKQFPNIEGYQIQMVSS